jgi:hypothetical protein
LITVNGVVVLVLLGFLFDRPAFFLDIALAYALLAFVLPIAVSRYFEQRERRDAAELAVDAGEAGGPPGSGGATGAGGPPPADGEVER